MTQSPYEFLNRLKEVSPHQLGWLRRPELDADGVDEQVWEKPDGSLQSFRGRTRKIRLVLFDKQVQGASFFGPQN